VLSQEVLQKETYRHSYAVTACRDGASPHMTAPPHHHLTSPARDEELQLTSCLLPLRAGYLYTLNLAAPERRWASMEPLYKAAQDTFTLAATGKDFVPPDKDPWRFW
jgi:hypothetical protein